VLDLFVWPCYVAGALVVWGGRLAVMLPPYIVLLLFALPLFCPSGACLCDFIKLFAISKKKKSSYKWLSSTVLFTCTWGGKVGISSPFKPALFKSALFLKQIWI
jgi:hypothetical protein